MSGKLVPAIRRVLLILLLVGAASCSKSELKMEVYGDGQWNSQEWELTNTRVERRGEKVIAHFVVEGPNDQRISIEAHIQVDPQVKFSYGRWTHIVGVEIAQRGVVYSSGVDFLGGQGGVPSAGGRFELKLTDGSERYRLSIPLTPAKRVVAGP